MSSSKTAFISIGSNIDPERHLPWAVKEIKVLGTPLCLSAVYQNPAIGSTPQPDFLNAAASIQISLNPLEIRDRLREIEHVLGRVRTEDRFAPRTIDLDLCFLNDTVLDHPLMTLPDPDVLERPHLAVPMAELDPEFIHPVTQESLREIAQRLQQNAILTHREDVQLSFEP